MTDSKRPATAPAPPVDEAATREIDAEPVVEQEQGDGRGERVPVRDKKQQDDDEPGIPAGHLVVGAMSTFVLGGWALWEWLGATGLLLAGGAVAATGGGYGYLRWRAAHPDQARALGSALGFGRDRRGGRQGGGGHGLLDGLGGSGGGRSGGGRSGGVGRRMSFGGGHGGVLGGGHGRRSGASSRIPSFLGAGSGSHRPTGRHVPLGRTPGTTAAGRAARQALARMGNPLGALGGRSGGVSSRLPLGGLAGGRGAGLGRSGGRGAFRPLLSGGAGGFSRTGGLAARLAHGTGSAAVRGARRARAHGRAVNSEWTGATQHLASGAGRHARRGWRKARQHGRAVNHAWTDAAKRLATSGVLGAARVTGRFLRWADRRTGHVTSGGWSARVRGDREQWDALRDAYRRWDAQLLFGLLTLTEWATRGLRGLWARWRKRRNSPPPDDDTPNEAAPTPTPPSQPPGLIITGARLLYRRNTSMSGLILPGGIVSPLVAMSAEMVSGVARFLPPDMWWVSADLQQLENVTGNVAAALRIYSRNLAVGYPIDHRIVDMFDEYATTVGKASDYAMAISSAFEQVHADDIKRRTQPRTNEHLWNV